MAVEAIKILKQNSKGSSRQAILNYIVSSFKLGDDSKMANVHLKQALKKGVAQRVLFNTKVSISVSLFFCCVI
jgi:histone H1/5